MANRFARKTGNWNASDVWSDTPSGTAGAQFVPVAGDVAMANSFTVTVNVNATCAEVRTDTTGGATAGGGFALSDGVTLTANSYSGTSTAVTFAGNTPAAAHFVGNVSSGATGTVYGISNTGTGALSVTGNVTGGSNINTHGAYNSSTGTLNITGNAMAGSSSGNGVFNGAAGTVTVTGNVTGGTGADGYGARNNSTGTMTIGGSATGGSTVNNIGAINYAAGTLTVGKAIGNAFGNGSVGLVAVPGVQGSSTGLTKVKSIEYGLRGQTPTVGNVFIEPDNSNQAIFVKSDLTTLTLSRTDGTDFGNPIASNVRYGVSYALGNLTGTCRVPTASQVSAGVAVDATVGTAVLTAENVRDAIGLTSANLDTQLDALPTAAENATAVWGETTREITGGTVTTLTNAPTVPSAGDIADAVRTELATELDHIDADISSRSTLTAGDIPAGLTAADVWGYVTRALTQQVSVDLSQLDETLTGLTEQVTAVNARIELQVPDGPVLVVPAPSLGQTTAWTMCYDEHGAPEADVPITVRLYGTGTATTSAWDSAAITVNSNAEGLASLSLPRNAGLRFQVRRGSGPWIKFSGVDAETLELPAILA